MTEDNPAVQTMLLCAYRFAATRDARKAYEALVRGFREGVKAGEGAAVHLPRIGEQRSGIATGRVGDSTYRMALLRKSVVVDLTLTSHVAAGQPVPPLASVLGPHLLRRLDQRIKADL